MRAGELDDAGALMVAAYTEYQSPLPPPMWRAYEAEIRDVRGRLADSALIVAEDAGRLVGAVTYYEDGTREPHGKWPPSWAVFRLLAVHPDARGRGVGRLLTDECLGRARDAGRTAMGLHTTSLMTVARTMYERMGFVRAPQHDFHPVPSFHVMAYHLPLAPTR